MESFYVSIIFLGIVLILFSFVWTALDSKKAYDHSREIGERKDELADIINDADQMIAELNKYSDYIVSLLAARQEEVSKVLKNAEEKIAEIEARAKVAVGQAFDPPEKAVLTRSKSAAHYGNKTSTRNQETSERNKQSEKVIPLNSRYRDVIKLADQGLSETEIAKKLGMGKGEIRLVIDTSRKVEGQS